MARWKWEEKASLRCLSTDLLSFIKIWRSVLRKSKTCEGGLNLWSRRGSLYSNISNYSRNDRLTLILFQMECYSLNLFLHISERKINIIIAKSQKFLSLLSLQIYHCHSVTRYRNQQAAFVAIEIDIFGLERLCFSSYHHMWDFIHYKVVLAIRLCLKTVGRSWTIMTESNHALQHLDIISC